MVGENAEPGQRLQAKILKSDIQTMLIRVSQGLPEGREIPHPRLKIEEVELNTTIMEPYEVIPVLCSSTQHFSESTHFSYGKYPVSEPTSGRALMIMILEGK